MRYAPLKPLLALALASFCLTGCQNNTSESDITTAASMDRTFQPEKWKMSFNGAYPHRPAMMEAVLYSDSLRALSKTEIVQALGTPNREEENHFFYTIEKSTLGPMTLNQKSIVIKFNDEDQVEWIKLHG